MKTFCVCVCACGSKADGVILGFLSDMKDIYEIFLLCDIFHGMLKWDLSNVGCKEPLEPPSPCCLLGAGLVSTSGSVDQVSWAWHVKMWKSPWMESLQLCYHLFLCWTALLVMWFILVSNLNLPRLVVVSYYISWQCGRQFGGVISVVFLHVAESRAEIVP